MEKINVQIFSSRESSLLPWNNSSIMTTLLNDPRCSGVEFIWDLSAFRAMRRKGAIVIAIVHQSEEEVATDIIADFHINPRLFLFGSMNFCLGKGRLTRRGKRGFKVIRLSRILPKDVIEAVRMLLDELYPAATTAT